MTAEQEEQEAPAKDSSRIRLGLRHLFAFIAFLGITGVSWMRVTLSVAFSAIVNTTASPTNSSDYFGPSSALDIQDDFVWTQQLQDIVLRCYFWGHILLQVPAAMLALRFGGKWIFFGGVLWTVVCTALSPVAAHLSPYCLITIRILEGIGAGVISPSLLSMLGRWTPKEEATLLVTIIFTGDAVGSLAGRLLAGMVIIPSLGWPFAFFIDAAVGLIFCLPWAAIVTNSPESNSRISDDERLYLAMQASRGPNEEVKLKGTPWRRVVTELAVWAFVGSLIAYRWLLFITFTCLPQYLSKILQFGYFGLNYHVFLALPFLIFLVFMLGPAFVFNALVKNSCARSVTARKVLNVVGFSGIAACLLILSFTARDTVVFGVLSCVVVSLIALIQVATLPNVLELSPLFSGSLMAFANIFATVTDILAPYLTDLLTPNDAVSEWSHVFYVGVGVAILGGLVFSLFASDEKRNWDSSDMECPQISDADAPLIDLLTISGLSSI